MASSTSHNPARAIRRRLEKRISTQKGGFGNISAKPWSADRLRVLKQLKAQSKVKLRLAHDLTSQERANIMEAIIEELMR